MAPYKEKVEFVPERKSAVRSVWIWITGLFASFVLGAIFTSFAQRHFINECYRAVKTYTSKCQVEQPDLNIWVGIAAMAVFICIRLWFGRK